jgi:hypothetical protein
MKPTGGFEEPEELRDARAPMKKLACMFVDEVSAELTERMAKMAVEDKSGDAEPSFFEKMATKATD